MNLVYLRCGLCQALAFDPRRLICDKCRAVCLCETYGNCEVCR